jgi:hypothetical protein
MTEEERVLLEAMRNYVKSLIREVLEVPPAPPPESPPPPPGDDDDDDDEVILVVEEGP